MTAKQTLTVGTTIHDETVELVETGRKWKLTLDGRRIGNYDCFEGVLVRALDFVPKHRRLVCENI